MKKIIEKILKIIAQRIIKAHNPLIVGITGSVGKTSAREAVLAVVRARYRARASEKNYNNEIGVPLTIIGLPSPGANPLGWLKVFWRGLRQALDQAGEYPQALVLEMGVDRPGDMDYLLSIARPRIGLLTLVGTVHAEYFADREALRQEKAKLLKAVPADSFCAVNYDNEASRRSSKDSAAKVYSYGFDEGAAVRAQEVRLSYRGEEIAQNLAGISFKLAYQGSFVPVLVPGVLGVSAVYAALAAAAVGLGLGLNLVEISQALRDFAPPRGRLRLVAGAKGAVIIDDTYNAEPESMLAALDSLARIAVGPGARRIAVLGGMLELGGYSREEHAKAGRYLAKNGIDMLVAVGDLAQGIAQGSREAGLPPDRIIELSDSKSASEYLKDRLNPGDLVLCKGSQGLRMERVVRALMAEPLRAKELLVRQDDSWDR